MIRYSIGSSGCSLVLTNRVLAHFASHRQMRLLQREAGGQLFARFEGPNTIIEVITGPRRSDSRSRFSYKADRLSEQDEIDRRFLDGLHYVGDWHTHPEDCPRPSARDRASIIDTVKKSKHSLNGFVLVIVGRVTPPKGLFVGIADVEGLWAVSAI